MKCRKCGNELKTGDNFCCICGTQIIEESKTDTVKIKKEKKGKWKAVMMICVVVLAIIMIVSIVIWKPVQRAENMITNNSSSWLEIKEKGYDTPEETAIAFMEAMKNKDVQQMMALFATDTYIQNYDVRTMKEKMGYDNVSYRLLPSGDNKFAKELNIGIRRSEIVRSLCYLYQEFASILGIGSTDVDEEESGQDVIDHFLLLQNEDDIFDIEVENEFENIKSLYEKKHSENNETNYEDIVRTAQEIQQAGLKYDEIKQMVVHFKWKNIPCLLFMEVVRYDDTWLILNLGGSGFSSLGLSRITYAVPLEIFEDKENQDEISDLLMDVLVKTREEQYENYEERSKIQTRSGYDSPEEAIKVFLKKMKQNDLEGMEDTLDLKTLVNRINIAKKIEWENSYDWAVTSIIPIKGVCAEILNMEILRNTYWIKDIYLSLVEDGVNPESTGVVIDIDKYINSIEKNDCSKLQYGEIIEQYPVNSEIKQYMDIEGLKEFSIELTLGERSEKVRAICIYYEGKWTLYKMLQEEN